MSLQRLVPRRSVLDRVRCFFHSTRGHELTTRLDSGEILTIESWRYCITEGKMVEHWKVCFDKVQP